MGAGTAFITDSSLTSTQHSQIYELLNTHPNTSISQIRTLLGRDLLPADVSLLAMAPSTRSRYLPRLQEVADASPHLHHEPLLSPHRLACWATAVLNRSSVNKFSTVNTYLTQLISVAKKTGIDPSLGDRQDIKSLLQGLSSLAALQETTQAKPLEQSVLVSAVERALKSRDLAMAALLSLSWLLGTRMGDVVRIPCSAISRQDSSFRMRLRKNRHSKSDLGYRVLPVENQSPLARIIRKYIDHRLSLSPLPLRLFSLTSLQAERRLQALDKDLSKHSMKRGVLIHLLKRGASEGQMLAISTHADINSLRHYVQALLPEQRAAAEAAIRLLGSS